MLRWGPGPDTVVAYEWGSLARCMLISCFLGCPSWQGMDEPSDPTSSVTGTRP